MSPPSPLRFLHGLGTWRAAEARLRAPGRQPALSGNDSGRTAGKKLEVADLVRGSKRWILSDALSRWGTAKPSFWSGRGPPSLQCTRVPRAELDTSFSVPTHPAPTKEDPPSPIHGLRWWLVHGFPISGPEGRWRGRALGPVLWPEPGRL